MKLTDKLQINGSNMYAPEQGMTFDYQDLDSADAGRDESGLMHRDTVRTKVGTFGFSYPYMTAEEYSYTVNLLSGETFNFTRPSLDGSGSTTTQCYCAKFGAALYNAVTGTWKSVKFNIIEC